MADLQRGTAALDRAQVELVAARVSALRECFY
jgi:AhpD family alkylhydroperoxidase